MIIDCSKTNTNVDFSGVDFDSVNAVIVEQTMTWVISQFNSQLCQIILSWIYRKTKLRYLVLRHRDFNPDISQVAKIDLQGRAYDKTEAQKLGLFSFQIIFLLDFLYVAIRRNSFDYLKT